MSLSVAVLGATGVVGESILSILEDSSLPVNKIYPLSSGRSLGKSVLFKNKRIDVLVAADFDFSQADLAFFSAGSKVSQIYAPKATAANCIVIDNTSAFRDDKNIPLVVPEANANKIADYKNKLIVANPNCIVAQMVVALKALHDAVNIKNVVTSTYQSVSGTGKDGILELINQTSELLNGRQAENRVYSKQIAFNILPEVDELLDNGFTKEEMKIAMETKKILADDKIAVSATAVRVPVLYGHSQAIRIELEQELPATEAVKILAKAKGVELLTDDYPTSMSHAVGENAVFIGRVRNDIGNNKALNLWVTADNIRKGAALNSVQIAEILYKNYLA